MHKLDEIIKRYGLSTLTHESEGVVELDAKDVYWLVHKLGSLDRTLVLMEENFNIMVKNLHNPPAEP